jgi:hypothetical protein
MTNAELKAREEAKRDRVQSSTLNWKQIEEVLTWAEAQLPPHLQRNRPRTHPGSRPTDPQGPSS